MKAFLALLMAGAFGGAFFVSEAEAARVGGGRSTGMQRSVTPPPKAAPQQATQAAPAAAAQPAAAGGSRWLGPLAGLAAGLGLGWLISQGGFGGALGGIILAVLGGLVMFALLRLYLRRNAAAQAQPMQYAGIGGQQPLPGRTPASPPGSDFGGIRQPAALQQSVAQAVAPNVPAGFDVAGFVKQAKINFLRLQEANDRGDLETLRDVCNDEMFASLQADIAARKHAPQHTEITGLDATLIEVVTEGDRHFASLSFTGSSLEDTGAAPQQFQEIWNLQKPVSGGGGWQLAGIQQVS